MPLNVQLVNAQVKDPQSGQMTPAGLIGSDAISTINTAKNQAIAAVQQKGEETLQSIPDDYTALSNEVDDVKTHLSQTDEIIFNGYTNNPPVANGSFSSSGVYTTNSKRLRTNFIPVKAGDRIVIDNGSLKHACGAWEGTLSTETNIRNDSLFNTNDEEITSPVNGYYIVVFAKQDATQEIALSDFDGSVLVYANGMYRNAKSIDEVKEEIAAVSARTDAALINSSSVMQFPYVAGTAHSRDADKVTVNIIKDQEFNLKSENTLPYLSVYAIYTDGTNESILPASNMAFDATLKAKKDIQFICVYFGAPASSGTFSMSISYGIGYETSKLRERISAVYNGDYKSVCKYTSPVPFGNYQIGDVVDISPLSESGNYYTFMFNDIIPGETFFVNLIGSDTNRPWAFLDKDYRLISLNVNAYAVDMTIEAPENAVYLVVQKNSGNYSDADIKRHNSFADFDKQIDINSLNAYSDMVNKLENASNSAKADTITAVKSRANLLNIIHFSDIHGGVRRISRLLEYEGLYSKYISDIYHTGDSVVDKFEDANPFASVGGDKVLNVIGNHDCWKTGAPASNPYNATAAEVYQKFFAPYISDWDVVSPGENLCYYYKDYATAKTRVIVLDCLHYDSTQESWFASALNDAKTNNMRVIAVAHYPAQTGLDGFDCTFNSLTRTIAPVETPAAGSYMDRMPESAFTVIDNFISGNGEFVCWLVGHTHDDFIGTVKQHSDQIQIIISNGNTDNRYSDCARTTRTKSEDLFNVFTVDGNAKLIKLIRVGSTMDKFMRKRETLCVNYSTRQIISNN